MFIDAKDLYGWAMDESLSHDEIEFSENVKLGKILNTPDSSDISNFLECHLFYPSKKYEKTNKFPFCPENRISPQNKSGEDMNEM